MNLSRSEEHYILTNNKKSRKDRRSKLEIYYDILNAITKESQYGEVNPTRVQFMSSAFKYVIVLILMCGNQDISFAKNDFVNKT